MHYRLAASSRRSRRRSKSQSPRPFSRLPHCPSALPSPANTLPSDMAPRRGRLTRSRLQSVRYHSRPGAGAPRPHQRGRPVFHPVSLPQQVPPSPTPRPRPTRGQRCSQRHATCARFSAMSRRLHVLCLAFARFAFLTFAQRPGPWQTVTSSCTLMRACSDPKHISFTCTFAMALYHCNCTITLSSCTVLLLTGSIQPTNACRSSFARSTREAPAEC